MKTQRFQNSGIGIRLSVCVLLWISGFSACSANRAMKQVAADPKALSAATAPTRTVAEKTPSCCAKKHTTTTVTTARKDAAEGRLVIPDVELITHEGKRVRFFSDLVQGHTVAINTFFTSCTTICPTIAATVSHVQKTLLAQGRDDIHLISISVDPTTDTPQRLKVWSRNFHVQPGWTMLTGNKKTVDTLLKALQSFTPEPQDHSPMILVGNEPAGVWKQVYGLAPAAQLSKAILDIAGPKAVARNVDRPASHLQSESSIKQRTNTAAREYFSDTELIDQHGQSHRFYSDLLRGRVVLIDSFFSSCTGVCPVLNRGLMAIKKKFKDQMGKKLVFLSLSVDPQNDTPARLKEYAAGLHAGEGWYFLTGKPENLKTVLKKLGMDVERREDHSNLFLVGNDQTGLWKKVFGLAPSEEIAKTVATVLNDGDGDRSADTGASSDDLGNHSK